MMCRSCSTPTREAHVGDPGSGAYLFYLRFPGLTAWATVVTRPSGALLDFCGNWWDYWKRRRKERQHEFDFGCWIRRNRAGSGLLGCAPLNPLQRLDHWSAG